MKSKTLFSGILLAGITVMFTPDSRANGNPFKDKLDRTQVQDTTKVRKNGRLDKTMPSKTDTSKWHKDHKKNWQDSTNMKKDYKMHDSTMKKNKKKY